MKLNKLQNITKLQKIVNKTTAMISIWLTSLFAATENANAQVLVPNGIIAKFEYNDKTPTTAWANQLRFINNWISADTIPSNMSAKTTLHSGLYIRQTGGSPTYWWYQNKDFLWKTALQVSVNPTTNPNSASDTTMYINTHINSTDGRKFRIKKISFVDTREARWQGTAKVVLDDWNNLTYSSAISTTFATKIIDISASNNPAYNEFKSSWDLKMKLANETWYNPSNFQVFSTNYIDNLRIEIEYEPCTSVTINPTNQNTYKWKENTAQYFDIIPWSSAVEIKWTDNPKTTLTPWCPNSSN